MSEPENTPTLEQRASRIASSWIKSIQAKRQSLHGDPEADLAFDILDALRAAQKIEWRSIDTAPKDGTSVLLRGPGRLTLAWWGDLHAADSEYGTVPHDECWGWLISDGHNDPIWYRGHPLITEWAPIPGNETPNVSGAVTGAVKE